jgi:hypothetical protein
MSSGTPEGQAPYSNSPGPENEYIGTEYPALPGNLPDQPNDPYGVDSLDSIEEASHVGTTDDDTEAQSFAVNYGKTDPSGGNPGQARDGFTDYGEAAFRRGVAAAATRPADVLVGAGGEDSNV